jgi:carbonic anhydrase
MKKLIRGLREFKSNYFSTHQELFEHLSHGQKPRVLFITCSDSRIVPNLITQTEPGEIFVIRNAGNIIPPFGAANGGEGAAVEYAIHALGIEQIIVCGHSHCGAMKGLLQIGKLEEEMPLVYEWLRHADATRRLVQENYQGYSKDELLEIAIAENVLTQIENLKTYPVVHSRLYQGKLQIFGWIYLIETGEILAYDPITHAYIPPQTQLETIGLPGQYVMTQAPPVTCDLPYHASDQSPPPQPSVVANYATQQQVSSGGSSRSAQPGNGNGKVKESDSGAAWLTPEQADRIYRGSTARK